MKGKEKWGPLRIAGWAWEVPSGSILSIAVSCPGNPDESRTTCFTNRAKWEIGAMIRIHVHSGSARGIAVKNAFGRWLTYRKPFDDEEWIELILGQGHEPSQVFALIDAGSDVTIECAAVGNKKKLRGAFPEAREI